MQNSSSFETFMNLDRNGCELASRGLMKNAQAKFKDAEILANNESWSTASSLMITSMEESIKSLILALDSVGFKFRGQVKGIKSLFNQHGLRYQFAFLLSTINIFVKDLKIIHARIQNREMLFNLSLQPEKVLRILKLKAHGIKKEIEWYERIGFHRERGLYYDVRMGMIDPSNFKRNEYESIAERVRGVLEMVKFVHQIIENENSRIQLIDLQEKFISEKWYFFINNLAEKVNSNKGPVFDEIKDFIEGFDEMLNDESTVNFMKENLEKFNTRLDGSDRSRLQ